MVKSTLDANCHSVYLRTDFFINMLKNENTFIVEVIEDEKIVYTYGVFLISIGVLEKCGFEKIDCGKDLETIFRIYITF